MATAPPADGESLYATLGVAPTASGETVRKAYRKLVLRCHPDKVRDAAAKPEAERLFRLIVTAYEVLSDDVRRAEYDKRTRLNGADVDDVLVNVTLKEALTGATKLAMVLEKKKCTACAGVGMRCESCVACAGRRVDATDPTKPCVACGGRGFGAPKPCDNCHSKGQVEDFFPGRVVVPAGVADGAKLLTRPQIFMAMLPTSQCASGTLPHGLRAASVLVHSCQAGGVLWSGHNPTRFARLGRVGRKAAHGH